MNTIKQLFENVTKKLEKISYYSPKKLFEIFQQALQQSPLILTSFTEFFETIQALKSKSIISSYTMQIAMIYVLWNTYHNWFYIGISFTGSIWAKKHYSEKFSADPNSILLSEYHAAEIEKNGKNLGEEIIILPIIIFPVIIELPTEIKSIIENLMRSIESSLIYACKQEGYLCYNDPIALSPNAPKKNQITYLL